MTIYKWKNSLQQKYLDVIQLLKDSSVNNAQLTRTSPGANKRLCTFHGNDTRHASYLNN